MIINVKRFDKQGDNSVLSEVFVDGEFFCFGLEDSVREVKIWSATAIPAGTYKLGIRKLGAMHAGYVRRFPSIHQGMIEIMDIPNFKYVYIHIGNNSSDTSGCILVGDSYKFEEGDYELRKSKQAYVRLYDKIIETVKKGKAVLEVS